MGDNFIQEIIGKGNDILSMRMEDHEIKGVLHEVLHVLGLVKTCSQLKMPSLKNRV
jgi:predicted Zn-dependent protease